MKKIQLSLPGRSYDILIGRGLTYDCGAAIRGLRIGRDAVVVTNERLFALYGKAIRASLRRAGLSVHFELVPDSERAKSAKVVFGLINDISTYDKDRTLFLVAFGGGVVGDVAGFAAAVYKRGIPYVQMPTTLLAQVDSAIGGKTAIDTTVAKNLVGAFYQPRIVLSDTGMLDSLAPRQMRTGMAEVIKYGVIKDARLFEYLENNLRNIYAHRPEALELIVSRSSAIKARVVEADEFDRKGARVILNYGHTIGHAIETASGYSGRYSHGEAISIGMVVASDIAVRLGLLKAPDGARIEALIKKAGLPTALAGLRLRDLYEAHRHDKKFIHGKNRFVLPRGIGIAGTVEDIPEAVIKGSLAGRLSR
ncbi:MAG: 3-dehydroquinate synthase [Candidatus Omnitrophota bacterium]